MTGAAKGLVTLCVLVLAGCVLRGGYAQQILPVHPTMVSPSGTPSGTPSAVRVGGATPTVSPKVSGDPYVDLARQLHARGVRVWFEADLVARWLEGPAAFQQALDRLGTLASVPGVVGFKVADELGYNDGIDRADQALAFLRAARSGLARVAPGAELLIDVVVPELGCLGWTDAGSQTCALEARAKHPAASEAAVSNYLQAHVLDRLDLSTSLLDEWSYRAWGLGQSQAQALAWQHVTALGWDRLTSLRSRKALADEGGYQGSPEQAARDADTFVAVPVAAGAQAVDVWTWRQQYDGHTVSLLGSDLAPNPLWRELVKSRQAGVRLVTHITPSLLLPTSAERSREFDLLASVFDEAFVAAGTG
jgi:hypothetical protein